VSATEEGPEEAFARACVKRILRAPVERRDRPGQDEVPDYHVVYDDRPPAALEVTTLTEPRAREIAVLSQKPLDVTPRLFTWRVTPHVGTNMKKFHQHVPELIRQCEEAGVADPLQLTDVTPAVEWWEAAPVEIRGSQTTRQPTVTVLRPSVGGATQDALDALTDDLSLQCAEPLIRRKVDKLARSQLAEQHLFLLVDESGMAFSPYYAVAAAEDVPSRSPEVPASLSDLWLASGYRLGGVLHWSRATGWSRHWPFDEPDNRS
jgi:hypothetical protein